MRDRFPTPAVDDRGVYPMCFGAGTWFASKLTDDDPPRKIPRAPWAYPDHHDRYVGHNDPEVWTDFETAREWTAKLPGFGLANRVPDVEADEQRPIFFDFDDVRDPETGAIHPEAWGFIQAHDLPAWLSSSGTGLHAFALVDELPEGYKEQLVIRLSDVDGWGHTDEPELEVYARRHFCALTGDHLEGTPVDSPGLTELVGRMIRERGEEKRATPSDAEPVKTRAELANVEATDDVQDVLDAIRHTGPRDVRLRSTVTEERADRSKSLDPSWVNSGSGTRLAQVDDGWVYRKGNVGLDALQVVALEERIIHSEGQYPSGEAFWEAVDALRDHGAHIPEYNPADEDPKPVAVLPPAVRDLSTASSGWDWYHVARDGQRDLTINDARDRTTAAIVDAYERHGRTLVEALPTMGKSYSEIKAAAETGEPISALTGRGHKEQYEQLREWCDERGLSHYTLPSFTRDCETANGEHGEEWADRVREWYNRGVTPREIHKATEYVLGRPLPCQEHEGQRCPYASKWDFNPDEYDVLIGHYTHAHKLKVTSGRAVVFDEFPGGAFETVLGPQLQGAISYWLAATEGVPFEDYTDLLENRDDQSRRADALLWFDERGVETDETHVFDDAKAHAAAPLAVFTLLASDDLGNGFEKANLGDTGIGVFDRERGTITLLRPPELQYASAVVALDGTPTLEMWERALGTRLNHRQVLADEERAEYIREALNLNLVRTTDAIKPYNSKDHVNTEQDHALLARIRERHGQRAGVVTTTTAEAEYDADDVLENVAETKHYGNVLGSNEFDETRVGAVIGSNHYGDGYIKKWAAYAGEAVERGNEKGAGLSYGGFGDRVLTHMREHETLQAAMRFGRDGNGAVVYVHTDTLPEWVPLAGEGRVIQTWSDGLGQVLAAADDFEEWRTAEIADHPDVELSQRQVFDHLNTLADRGVLSRDVDEADRRGYVWRDDGLHRLNEHGNVELDPVDVDTFGEDEVAEVARSSIYTWEFRNSRGDPDEGGVTDGPAAADTTDRAAAEGDPPPDDQV